MKLFSIGFKNQFIPAFAGIFLGNLTVTSYALETPFLAYKDGYANSAAYTGNSRTLIVRADSKAWMSHAFPDGSGKGLQGARLQIYVKDMVHDGVLKVSLAPSLGTLENQTHLSDLVFKDSVGSVILKAADHIQHVVEIPLSAAFTKAIQDNAYAGLVLESSGNLDVELGTLEGDHGAVILLNYNSASTVVTANVISVDSLANKLFADHSTELRGPTGTNGSSGAKGDNGLNGKDGSQGPKGDSGARGPQGIKGDKGDPGTVGAKGDAGNAGSITSLPAAAITGLDTFVVNRVTTNLGGKANIASPVFTGSGSFSGNLGIGTLAANNTGLWLRNSGLVESAQEGFFSDPLFSSEAIVQGTSASFRIRTVAAPFTMKEGSVVRIEEGVKGLGSTITNLYGLKIEDQNIGIYNWALYTKAGKVHFGDNVDITGKHIPGLGVLKVSSVDNSMIVANAASNTYTSGLRLMTNDTLRWDIAQNGIGENSGNDFTITNPSGIKFFISRLTGKVGIGDSLPTEKLSVAGNIKASGTVSALGSILSSDARFKKEISPLTSSLEKVRNLQGVTYKWKMDEFPNRGFDNTEQIGFIAQEVEKVVPQLVVTGADGYKGVDYSKLTPILVEAMKSQQKQIENQQNQIAELKLLICLDHPQSSQCN